MKVLSAIGSLIYFFIIFNFVSHNIVLTLIIIGITVIIVYFVTKVKSSKEAPSVKKEKFIYTFDIQNIDWTSLKSNLKIFYEPLGFSNIVIDKEKSWMLESDENTQAYILASLKDNLITLEVYNAPEFELNIKTNAVKENV